MDITYCPTTETMVGGSILYFESIVNILNSLIDKF
jgi:hypothetical protein